jgi:hypothetical protein
VSFHWHTTCHIQSAALHTLQEGFMPRLEGERSGGGLLTIILIVIAVLAVLLVLDYVNVLNLGII